jgi:hypothetical protein
MVSWHYDHGPGGKYLQQGGQTSGFFLLTFMPSFPTLQPEHRAGGRFPFMVESIASLSEKMQLSLHPIGSDQ